MNEEHKGWTEQQKRMDGLIGRMERHQAALRLSDKAFAGRYHAYVGSTKTWRERLIPRAWGELGARLDKWEGNLGKMVAAVEGRIVEMEGFQEALPIWRYADGVYNVLQGQRSDRRCAMLICPTGCGKSWSLMRLRKENQKKAVYLAGDQTWRGSFYALSKAFALALGVAPGNGAGSTFQGVLEHLQGAPMTVLLDDAHEGGTLVLKLVRNLIDKTGCRFVLGVYPSTWSRVINASSEAIAEAQQLMGRTLRPINQAWAHGLRRQDVAAYLAAAGGLGQEEAGGVAERILQVVQHNGNLRLLDAAIELAEANASEEKDGEVTGETIEGAVEAMVSVNKENER